MTRKVGQFHEHLILENFTAFRKARLDFAPGVNVIIGENGTGKTHILKALYAAQLIWLKNNGRDRVQGVFQIEDSIEDLIRSGPPDSLVASASGVFGSVRWSYRIEGGPSGAGNVAGDRLNVDGMLGSRDPAGGSLLSSGFLLPYEPRFVVDEHPPSDALTPVFIPAVDMLGHTKGFVSTFDNYKIDFDLTHREIVSLLLSPEKRELDDQSSNLVAELTQCLGGKLELKGERFYLVREDRRLPMPSVAEGLRKIATLIRLVQTGWLSPGSTLFWDEPEVNLNPMLMGQVIGALLALARSGVQVFLATHSYVILKELDLQLGKNEDARFFALKPSKDGTEVSSFEDFSQLVPNAILDQYGSLFDRELSRATRRPFKRAN